jgi:N-acetyl-D-muramate 6-phosphate phosphatase
MTSFHWIKAVLFDLDGTLLDTAPDMAAALQKMRADRSLPPAPFEVLRPRVSSGARGMIAAGFGIGTDHPDFPSMKEEFLSNYESRICIDSKLFDGMAEALGALQERSVRWGIVTNKHQRFTLPLVSKLKSQGILRDDLRCGVVVCGDTTPYAKPHPQPLLHAAQALDVDPRHSVYVGDDIRDVQSAHAAGMPAIAARYGYLGTEPVNDWNADAHIDSPHELIASLSALVQKSVKDSESRTVVA